MAQQRQLGAHRRAEDGAGLDVWQYLAILRRRVLWFAIPFVLVLGAGFAVVMMLPAVYVAEGKLLVESQQIPTELVRPTITATAKERIQVIEQRVMTRENLLAIADKFQMLGARREAMSGTQVIDLMRLRTRMTPFELDQPRRRNDTIALKIGFEHEHADIAMKVANELLTLILDEDARNRTRRAQETTNFLAREVKKLEGELGAIDAQMAEFKQRFHGIAAAEKATLQLAVLKAELQEKATLYTDAHPEMIRIKRQIAALEKMAGQTAQYETGLEALQNQRAAVQKNLDAAAQKAQAARLGESLERAQFSERLEVLEQAIMPQRPSRPNRPKLLGLALALALGAGVATVVAVETLTSGIRGPRDLHRVADAYLLVSIPYIATKKEVVAKRIRTALATSAFVAAGLTGLVTTHLMFRPLDQLWFSFLARLLG
jgi:protein tyrosine kinase modulator